MDFKSSIQKLADEMEKPIIQQTKTPQFSDWWNTSKPIEVTAQSRLLLNISSLGKASKTAW